MTDVILAAHDLIRGERARHYGPPHKNFEVIAGLWHVYLKPRVLELMELAIADPDNFDLILGQIVDENDVCNLMSLLKIAREATGMGYHEDSTIDVIGYQGIKQLLTTPIGEFLKEMK